jgi:hypothetical protein
VFSSAPPRPARSRRSKASLLVLLGALFAVPLALACAADQPAKTPSDAPKSDAPRPPERPLDDLRKLPPGAVIVVVDSLNQATRLLQKSIVLAPEDYQKLLDQIDQLKAQLKPEKPLAPSVCEVTGQVDGNLARLRAQFKFITPRPNMTVMLALGAGRPTEAALDDHLPALQATDEGFVVQVEKPGEHQLRLDLELQLAGKGGERGLDLDLPKAAITTLALDLPETVKEVRLTLPDASREPKGSSWTLATKPGPNKQRLETGALGPVGRLELAWKGTAPPPGAAPLLTGEGRVTVRIGEPSVITDIELTLRTLRGQTLQWRLLLPPGATLVKPALPDDRVESVETPDPKNPLLQVVRLKGSSTDPVQLSFQVRQQRVEGQALPVGPFAVLGAQSQQGSVVVSAPSGPVLTYRLRVAPEVAVSQRELTEDERRRDARAVAAFTYSLPPLAEAKPPAGPSLQPFLHIEPDTARGLITTRTTHKLKLGERGWHLTTEMDVTPLRSGGVDQLLIQLPPGYEYEPRRPRPAGAAAAAPVPSDAGVKLDYDPTARTVLVTLAPRKSEPFLVALEGNYPVAGEPPPADGLRHAALELPQPRKTEDRGGQVTVVVPRDVELVPPHGGDPFWEGLVPGRLEHTCRLDRMPERVELAWRQNRPEMAVQGLTEVTLSGSQAQVRERLTFPASPAAGQLLLWVPESVPVESVRLNAERARPAPADDHLVLPRKPGFRPWYIALLGPADKEHPLTLEYALPLPEAEGAPGAGRRFPVALVLPEQATRLEMKVRVYTAPGTLAALAGSGPWEEGPLEVGDRDVLPALVLRGSRLDQPPQVRLSEAATNLATVLIGHVLVQARVAENGLQTYRVRFLLNQLNSRHLDLEFPAPPSFLNLKVTVQPFRADDAAGDEEVHKVAWGTVDEGGAAARPELWRIARLALAPELVRRPVVLDVEYQVPMGRGKGNGLLQSTLTPPVLRGDVGRAPVGWQVTLPPDWVPLDHESGYAVAQKWGWRGWLLGPRPSLSEADLERWFYAGPVPASAAARASTPTNEGAAAFDTPEPVSLVCWRSSLEPLRLDHVPQQSWLLACSLVLLAVGLGLYMVHGLLRGPASSTGVPATARARVLETLFWLLVVGLCLGVGVACKLWPGVLLPVLYGFEPGAAVLLLVFAVQWMRHQHYRRQVVFMPGFTRVKSGSSLIRNGGSNPPARPRGEPSTVDVPPAPSTGSWRPASPPEG